MKTILRAKKIYKRTLRKVWFLDNVPRVAKTNDITYDVNSNQFRDLSDGRSFTDSDFAELAKSDRARQVNAGSTTLKRAAIASTLLREPAGNATSKLLDGISKLALQSELLDSQLKGVLYQSPDTARSNLIQQ